MSKQQASYGEWVSPISAADTISSAVSFGEIAFDNDHLYWIEGRPSEGGRQVLVRRSPDGTISDVTPAPINVRTRVHEYGGGSFHVADGVVYYSDFADQRLYRISGAEESEPVTPEPANTASVRFADGRALADGRLVYVRETHHDGEEPTNEIVIIDPVTGAQSVFATNADFYSNPRPSPDGTRLAWIEWDHPNMPWDDTRLMVGPLDRSSEPAQVAGGIEEAVTQPTWAADGRLLYVSDPTGWWNLHEWDGAELRPVLEMEAEFGVPPWVFGASTYGYLSDGRLIAAHLLDGIQRLGIVEDGELRPLDLGFTYHSGLTTDGSNRVWFGGYGAEGSALIEYDADADTFNKVRSNPPIVEEAYRPDAEVITFPTEEGEAHAVFYPPANADFEAPKDERPPLIVKIHGGPTSRVFPHRDPGFAFWTSRGFGIVDVNYRGSTGYGRGYRNKLRGAWGIADVEDAAAAARYLAGRGDVDPDKLLISGGSAGGFTVLAALATTDVFRSGASYYGVADLRLLNEHTHKFESRYLDLLVSDDDEILKDRSPLTHVDGIDVPVVLLQGLKDQVVPPEQAEVIVEALAARGVPYAYITYENEDHGFRDAANIVHALESELGFYGQVLGFTPAGDIPPVEIVGQG